jgi:hypothetical protein
MARQRSIRFVGRRAARSALVLATVVTAAWTARFTYRERVGIDFCQYWSVGAARRLSAAPLPSPYVNGESYAAAIDRYAAASGDGRLVEANSILGRLYPRGLELNNSPLLYAAFAGMPIEYSTAWALFVALRVALLLGALYLLVPRGDDGLAMLVMSIPVIALFRPLGSDARVGNVAVCQLFAIVALARVAGAVLSQASRWAPALSATVLTGAGLLVLTKPNVAPIAAALAISLWLRGGPRVFLRGAALAVVPLLASALLPCAWLGSWSAWSDWLRLLDPFEKLALWQVAGGNFSLSLLLGQALGIPANAIAAALAVVLAGSAAVGLGLRRDAGVRMRAVLRDPLLAGSLAICAVLATSPLAWFHYYVLALAPALALVAAPDVGPGSRILGGAGLVLASGIIGILVPVLEPAVPWMLGLSWIPLWAGTLRVASGIARSDGASAQASRRDLVAGETGAGAA